MLRAIVRATSPALARCALTYQSRQEIDVRLATAQFDAYVAALREAAVDVRVLPAEPDLPDAAFVEDTAVVFDEFAVICRPGATTRRSEVESIVQELAGHRTLEHIHAPATLDGGDVLRIGRRVFVGVSRRTNAGAVSQLARILEQFDYEVIEAPVYDCLHLKTGVSYVRNNTVLINADWVDASCFSRYEQIAVAPNEPWAANCLVVNDVVFVSSRSPTMRRVLEERGCQTRALEITEFEKAEAGLTCLSLLLSMP